VITSGAMRAPASEARPSETKRGLKVLHVIPSVGPLRGGPSVMIRTMTRGLARAGLEVHVAATDDNGDGRLVVPHGVPLVEDGVAYHYFPRQTGFYAFSWPLTRWLASHVRDYDLVHIHALFSYAAVPAAYWAARAGIPYVVRPLGTLNRWGMQRRRRRLKRLSFRLIERRILRGAACVHYASEQERLEAAELGVEGRSRVAPLGIDLAELEPLPPRGGFRQREPALAHRTLVLFLSRLDPKKGLDLLLEAFAAARTRRPELALVVAGSGSEEFEAALRRQAAGLGLDGDVWWAGFLGGRDKLAALADADLFVLPSYSENFGVAAVEALAAGLPVIISDRVGIHREVAAAGAGVVVPCDAGAVADATARLASDTAFRADLGTRGRRLARERFSVEAMVPELVAMYTLALHAGRRAMHESRAALDATERYEATGKPWVPITAVVLTYDEEKNLDACLGSLSGWIPEVFVVDSGSTDRTVEIADRYGARVVRHPFETHARQWAWAIENLPCRYEWILGLDADQRVMPELRAEIQQVFGQGRSRLDGVDGFYVKRRQVFRGRWIRHGGYYPKYLLKLFRRGRVAVDRNDLLDHHFRVRGRTAKLEHDLIEENHKESDISFWIEKHNRYAMLLAQEEAQRGEAGRRGLPVPSPVGEPDERVLWRKRVWARLPLFARPFLYFAYRYFLRLGFLDGKEGLIFHFLHACWFRFVVDVKLDEVRHSCRR